jgi:chromosome partitioning protein
MRIVALGQQKGGCGKSSAALNLACQAIAAGRKAALVDMDIEQGTSLKWASRRSSKEAPFVLAADVIGLPKVLKDLKEAGAEWVFLDLPGRSAPVSSAGLTASHMILIPCRPFNADLEASVSTVRAARGLGRPYAYLMNIAPGQGGKKRAKGVASELEAAGHPVAPTIIVQRVIVPDAMAEGKAANETDKVNDSAAEFRELFQWLDKKVKSE